MDKDVTLVLQQGQHVQRIYRIDYRKDFDEELYDDNPMHEDIESGKRS